MTRLPACVVGLLIVGLGYACPPASAALVDLSENKLTIRDTEGQPNLIDVRTAGFGLYEVYDGRSDLQASGGCTNASPRLVRCRGFALDVSIDAGGGDDLVGVWDDLGVPVQLEGGPGDDGLAGGPGADALTGGEGNDSLSGGAGSDRVVGDGGDDFADGQAGADTLVGGDGDDILDGSGGNLDVLLGDSGRDLIAGGPGNDQLQGGSGDDTLVGGPGLDQVGTGLGADEVFGADGARDVVDCRATDRVRGQIGERLPGCAALPAREKLPTRWPPTSGSGDTAATVSQLRPDFHVGGSLVRAGAARRAWLRIASSPPGSRYRVDAVIAAQRSGRIVYRHCFKRLWTNTRIPRTLPRQARRANHIGGHVLQGKRCR